jgi:hypothetical protein
MSTLAAEGKMGLVDFHTVSGASICFISLGLLFWRWSLDGTFSLANRRPLCGGKRVCHTSTRRVITHCMGVGAFLSGTSIDKSA